MPEIRENRLTGDWVITPDPVEPLKTETFGRMAGL